MMQNISWFETNSINTAKSGDFAEQCSTQEYWVNEQITDYEYMKTISDSDPLKRKAQKDWPLDFSTQKYWYNEQIEAKERIQ